MLRYYSWLKQQTLDSCIGTSHDHSYRLRLALIAISNLRPYSSRPDRIPGNLVQGDLYMTAARVLPHLTGKLLCIEMSDPNLQSDVTHGLMSGPWECIDVGGVNVTYWHIVIARLVINSANQVGTSNSCSTL